MRIDIQFPVHQSADLALGFLPGLPDRRAPAVDSLIACRVSLLRDHLGDRYRATVRRRSESWPLLTVLRQSHVCQLDLLAGVAVLQMQIQADQSKGRADQL